MKATCTIAVRCWCQENKAQNRPKHNDSLVVLLQQLQSLAGCMGLFLFFKTSTYCYFTT